VGRGVGERQKILGHDDLVAVSGEDAQVADLNDAPHPGFHCRLQQVVGALEAGVEDAGFVGGVGQGVIPPGAGQVDDRVDAVAQRVHGAAILNVRRGDGRRTFGSLHIGSANFVVLLKNRHQGLTQEAGCTGHG